MIAANSQTVKLLNQMLVLRSIQMNDSISRQQIARATKLSNGAISMIVSELIDSGIVKELGEGESNGGRRSKLLGINEEGGYILAADVGSSKIVCGIVDLRANILEKRSIDAPAEPNERLAALIQLLQEVKDTGRITGMDPFIGVGIAASGYVDARSKKVTSTNMGWKEIDLKKEIEYAVGLETLVENDSKAGALAEYYYGAGIGVEDMLYIAVGNGIGSGLINRGSLVTGKNNAAGEIAHMQMEREGTLCECGEIGCLEAVASGKAIERQALQRKDYSRLFQSYIAKHGKITAQFVFDCAKQGDPEAVRMIDEAIAYIAMATKNMLRMFNPEVVVFSGGLSLAGSYYLDRIQQQMKPILMKTHHDGVQIKLSSFGKDSGLLGAATIVIERLFRPIEAQQRSEQAVR